MKTVQLLLGVVVTALVCGSVLAAPVDRIVAVVNDEVITLSELSSVFAPYKRSVEATYRGQDLEGVLTETRRIILNRMIDDGLLEQEAKKTGIIVRDEEVMDAINNGLVRRNTSMDALIKTLSREGKDLDMYKKEMRRQIVKMKLIRRELKSKLIVSDEEIGDYYRRHRADYEGKEAVRIRQIMIRLPDKAGRETREKLKEDAAQLLKRIKDGEPFERVAASYSEGPAASSGGDIGFIEKGAMLPEVEDVAFRLALNEISDVIESSIGFHVITVVDKRGAGIKPLEAVREEIMSRIDEEKLEKKYDGWIEDLRKKSHIEVKL